MIRKYLICGKQILLSSRKNLDVPNENTLIIELQMPLELMWEITDLLKKYDVLLSQGDEGGQITSLQKLIFQKVAPYSIKEKDRIWLYSRAEVK